MAFQGDSIYWVEVEKVVPNPFQPRREFDQNKLQELADSIRMYGVLQPLTVTRNEVQREDGTFYTEYELIAGERRLRASKLAGSAQVPVIIREGEQNEQEKLELAIIENLQREDLNAVDRALAFKQLAEVFALSHAQVAEKVGRSREYVSNSIRLLGLPEKILEALKFGNMSEGHARTLLMLNDRPEEQDVIFREILLKKMSVREVERIVRKIATDKVRKKSEHDLDTHLIEYEKQFTETLGTRVQIQKTDFGGKLTIDYFSDEDLQSMLERMKQEAAGESLPAQHEMVARLAQHTPLESVATPSFVPPAPVVSEPPAPVVEEPSLQDPVAQKEDSYAEKMMAFGDLEADVPEVPEHDTYNDLVAHEPAQTPVSEPYVPPVPAYQPPVPRQDFGVQRYAQPAPHAQMRTPAFNPNQLAAVDSYDDVFPVEKTPTPQPAVTPQQVPAQPTQTQSQPETPKKPVQDDDSSLYSINNFNV